MTRFALAATLVLGMTVLSVADPAAWAKLYSFGEWKTLQHLYDTGMLTAEWQTLWKALQATDSAQATQLYRKAIAQDKTGTAEKIAKQRLQQLTDFSVSTKTAIPTSNNNTEAETLPVSELRVERAIPLSPPRSLHIPDTSIKELPVRKTDEVSLLAVDARPSETQGALKNEPISNKDASNHSGKYVAQFGVYSLKATADKVAQQIRDAGFTVEISESQTDNRTLYRVWSGRFETQKEAATRVAAVMQKIQVEGIATRIE